MTMRVKQIISYSGGLGSFMSAYLSKKNHGADNCVLLFADTHTEDEDLYRFLKETVAFLGINLVTLDNNGENIWDVFTRRRFMGNSRVDPCSETLKRKPLDKWVREHYTPDNSVRVVGIGPHEAHRLVRIKAAFAPWPVSAPLIDEPHTKEQIAAVLDKAGIEPPRLYEMGFPHNNCGGFCVKTGQRQMALLLKELPEKYRWHELQQEKLFKLIGKRHGTIRITVDGELQYWGLKEFREFLEKGGKPQLYSEPGCGCVA